MTDMKTGTGIPGVRRKKIWDQHQRHALVAIMPLPRMTDQQKPRKDALLAWSDIETGAPLSQPSKRPVPYGNIVTFMCGPRQVDY